jgi:hypothetical protein
MAANGRISRRSALSGVESLWNETYGRSVAGPLGEVARPVLVSHLYLH